MSVTPSTPEPLCDILAQISALRSPAHPKRAVFVAAGNEWAIPRGLDGIYISKRSEGTLLTLDRSLANRFASANPLTDELLAEILGYPEPKLDALRSGEPVIVRATDSLGNVITEAVVAKARLQAARKSLAAHGRVEVLSPVAMQRRRAALNGVRK